MAVLQLQQGIVYGPVRSRRLGLSLGLNIMPTRYKLCPFNCVYCQYGWSKISTIDLTPYVGDLPTADQIESALTVALEAGAAADYITFSGNGEASAHPDFNEIVERVQSVRDELLPEAKTCILSNSVGVGDEQVRRALSKLDMRIMKLDAGDEYVFQSVNRPAAGVRLAEIISGLQKLQDIQTQTLFVAGSISNAGERAVKAWMEKLAQVRPVRGQIYSLDRPPAKSSLQQVPMERLLEIASATTQQTGIPIDTFGR